MKLKKTRRLTICDLNLVSDSWNVQLHLYVYKCSCKECYVDSYTYDIFRT